jgi:hypothetical protein
MSRRVATPAIAATLLAVAPWITWWTAELSEHELLGVAYVDRSTLLTVTSCWGDECRTHGTGGMLGATGLFAMVALIAAALAAGALAFLRATGRDDALAARVVRISTGIAFASGAAALGLAMLDVHATPSWGALFAAGGAVLARYAGASEPLAMPDAAVGTPAPSLEVRRAARSAASSGLRFAVASSRSGRSS